MESLGTLMTGWGMKEGGIVKNWKRRFFVLKKVTQSPRSPSYNPANPITHVLFYYKSEAQAATGSRRFGYEKKRGNVVDLHDAM